MEGHARDHRGNRRVVAEALAITPEEPFQTNHDGRVKVPTMQAESFHRADLKKKMVSEEEWRDRGFRVI